jgi:hypothetical protein
MYSIGVGASFGFSLAGAVHLIAKRPYIVAAIAAAALAVSLMKPVPPPPSPLTPSVTVNWSGK